MSREMGSRGSQQRQILVKFTIKRSKFTSFHHLHLFAFAPKNFQKQNKTKNKQSMYLSTTTYYYYNYNYNYAITYYTILSQKKERIFAQPLFLYNKKWCSKKWLSTIKWCKQTKNKNKNSVFSFFQNKNTPATTITTKKHC